MQLTYVPFDANCPIFSLTILYAIIEHIFLVKESPNFHTNQKKSVENSFKITQLSSYSLRIEWSIYIAQRRNVHMPKIGFDVYINCNTKIEHPSLLLFYRPSVTNWSLSVSHELIYSNIVSKNVKSYQFDAITFTLLNLLYVFFYYV